MEPEQQNSSQETSKKAAKKEAAKAEKLRRKQEAAAAAAAASGVAGVSIDGPDPLAANYGDVPIEEIQSKAVSGRVWTTVSSLTEELKNQTVLIRGRAQAIRAVGKKMAFLTVRERGYTVQCVLTVAPEVVSAQMVKFATGISKESFIDIEGVITVPPEAIKGASQQMICGDYVVEIQVRKIHCVNRAATVLPINVEDAARSEVEIEKALEAGEQLVRVNQDTRLNYRILDVRTPANQGIFRLECQVSNFFRQFLLNEDFIEINTPKLTAGTSEGGAAVFKLEYKKQPACLAQSPQLHKQMAICGDFGRVFIVGPVFRAEDSYTHRHLCEFIGLDMEMEIKEHYSEVMDVVDRLFVGMFDRLNERCQKELEAIGKQYPFKPLKYLRKTLRLTFEEGVQMLKEAGVEVDPFGDLNTESERTLGKLVLEKYGTEFYILHRYPLAVRPFYTMPCPDNEAYSNSFDVFIRGEEIISGAQRVHIPELLESRATACGIDVKTISSYVDSFRYGAPPHGGFGVGLERVVMLFCALDNIRKTSLFPRDPRRLEP
ncbi:putative aspartate--tRNA ligase [Helianthus annuus]|nr:putative aspartate--tRNA ligase [Helianthus annuus]